MKKTVDFDLFTRLKYPCGLLANGAGSLCYAVRSADVEKNRYRKALWVWQSGKARRLKVPDDFTGHWWLNGDTLLLALPGKDKKLAPLPKTRLLALPIAGGEGRTLAEVDLAVSDAAALGDGRVLLLAGYDPDVEAALAEAGGDEAKAAKALREAQNADVLERMPFCANGGGFTGRGRGRVYLLANGAITPLTGEDEDVISMRLAPEGDAVYCVSQPYAPVAPAEDRLFRLALGDGARREMSLQKVFRHDEVVPLAGGGFVVAGSNMRRYGLNQNPAIYRVGPAGRARALYTGGAYGGWQSVGSDLAMPAGGRWAAQGGRVLWLSTVDESSQLMAIDVKSGAIEQLTHTPGAIHEIAVADRDIYFTAMRGQGGPEVYRLGPNGGEKQLTRLNTAATQAYALALPEPISFTNAAGTEIRGWVLRPPALAAGQRCPAILDIHGGPKTVYGPVLFHEMQLWAARGFGVMFCNPTGGDGRGDAFSDIRGAYGKQDYEDLMAFTDVVLKKCPWIDPDRVGVTGGSYGGFMTNWIIGHTSRFAAAASQRSISNWATMALLSDIGYFFEPDQAGVDIIKKPTAVWSRSPLKYAREVTTPTLFIHSDEDYRCPAPEGLQMFAALRLAGVDTRMVLFHGENHELSRSGKPKARLRRLEEITAWFEKYLKNEKK